MPSNIGSAKFRPVRGWVFDVYPADQGDIAVWIIGESGERIRLVDRFQPKIYVSGKQEDLERLASTFYRNVHVAWWGFSHKFAHPTDVQKSWVLEVALKDCRRTAAFTRDVLKMGDYLRHEVHNCDLHGDRAYLFYKNIFPLERVEVDAGAAGLQYRLLDSVESTCYTIPPLRCLTLTVELVKNHKLSTLDDPIGKITVTQANQQASVDSGGEGDKLLWLAAKVKELDPDIVLTSRGDSSLFPYLIHRATENKVLEEFVLSRDHVPFESRTVGAGRTYFSYGRTFYRATTVRLFGRVDIDESNTFALRECGFEGLFEVTRLCRMPLHTASRASIGSSMSSLQFYQAIKDDVLIPRNKSIPEVFKSA